MAFFTLGWTVRERYFDILNALRVGAKNPLLTSFSTFSIKRSYQLFSRLFIRCANTWLRDIYHKLCPRIRGKSFHQVHVNDARDSARANAENKIIRTANHASCLFHFSERWFQILPASLCLAVKRSVEFPGGFSATAAACNANIERLKLGEHNGNS